MSSRTVVIGSGFIVIVLAVFGVWLFNYVSVEKPLQRVLTADPRNQVVKASAHFDGWVDSKTLVFDLTDVSGKATRMDVFRSFLQYAQSMKERHFTKVILACRGANKFTLDGDYFQQLGHEYATQNPMYTIRTFPIHVAAIDGTKPFSEYSGGILGVLQKEMEQFTDFNDQWYVKDLHVVASTESTESDSASATSASATPTAPASATPTTADNDWLLLESTNKMDNTPEVVLRKDGTDGATLTIRCVERKTEAYVNTDTILDNSNVRIRFDDSAPVRQGWGKSTDDKALFAPDAVTLARELAKAHTFLVEFTPFRERGRTVSFDVSGLDTKLQKISETCDWNSVDKSRARARAADAALRERVAPHVHPCAVPANTWCWSDPNDALFSNDTYGGQTREEAIRSAMQDAKWGLAFKADK